MKKFFLAVLIILMIVPSAYSVGVYYSFDHKCSLGDCIEGSRIEFSISIRASEDIFLKYNTISVREVESNNSLAVDNDANLIVTPSRNVSKKIIGTIPPPSAGSTITYRPCFTYTILDSDLNPVSPEIGSCGKDTLSFTALALADVGCYVNNDCSYYQICHNHKCKLLECGECQYIENHECFDYECCRSRECKADQACIENECTNLNCKDNEFLENHKCIALDCDRDETAVNHECIKLNCSEDEHIINQECVKLNCNTNEYIKEHECLPLICDDDEKAEDYECKKLKCGLFSDPASHQCKFNGRMVFRILGTIIVITAIVGYLAYIKRD